MSGIVTEDDLSAFAAEYVIGTLDPDERARANAQLEIDEGFRALVRGWERRLGELHLMVEPVEPDGRIWDRISGRLGMRAPPPPPPLAPPPFAPEPAATPALAPVAAPPASIFGAPLSAPFPPPLPASAAPIAPAFEPSFESRLEPEPYRPLPSAAPFPPPAPPPQSAARTPEQELASLIEEADKFSTQLAGLATAAPAPEAAKAAPAESRTESLEAVSQTESLLAEAADAIVTKPIPNQPDQAEQVAEAWPEETAVTEDLPPPIRRDGPRRDATMLMSPADVAHLTVRRQQRRIGRWRATALLMAFLALGLSSLIMTWRFAPDRLPHQLQPIAVLGLGDWSPSERTPAEHGTQFEE